MIPVLLSISEREANSVYSTPPSRKCSLNPSLPLSCESNYNTLREHTRIGAAGSSAAAGIEVARDPSQVESEYNVPRMTLGRATNRFDQLPRKQSKENEDEYANKVEIVPPVCKMHFI